jgi:hypothetical protein
LSGLNGRLPTGSCRARGSLVVGFLEIACFHVHQVSCPADQLENGIFNLVIRLNYVRGQYDNTPLSSDRRSVGILLSGELAFEEVQTSPGNSLPLERHTLHSAA